MVLKLGFKGGFAYFDLPNVNKIITQSKGVVLGYIFTFSCDLQTTRWCTLTKSDLDKKGREHLETEAEVNTKCPAKLSVRIHCLSTEYFENYLFI